MHASLTENGTPPFFLSISFRAWLHDKSFLQFFVTWKCNNNVTFLHDEGNPKRTLKEQQNFFLTNTAPRTFLLHFIPQSFLPYFCNREGGKQTTTAQERIWNKRALSASAVSTAHLESEQDLTSLLNEDSWLVSLPTHTWHISQACASSWRHVSRGNEETEGERESDRGAVV